MPEKTRLASRPSLVHRKSRGWEGDFHILPSPPASASPSGVAEGWSTEPAPSRARTQPQTSLSPSTFSSSPAGFAPSLLRLCALKLFLGLNRFWQAGLLLACPSPHHPPHGWLSPPPQPQSAPRLAPAPPPRSKPCQGHGKSARSLRGKSVQMRPSKRVGRDGEEGGGGVWGGTDSWVGASVPEFDVSCKQPCKCSGAALEVTCPPPRWRLGTLGPSRGGGGQHLVPLPQPPRSLPALSRDPAGTGKGPEL